MRTLFDRAIARRRLIGLLASTTLIALPGLACADNTAETLRLALGGETSFTLQENPSTGYRWHLVPVASSNLNLVEISDSGFTDAGGRPLIGAPGQRHFRIKARTPGTAVAVFDYLRDWENQAAVQRHTVTIEIAAP